AVRPLSVPALLRLPARVPAGAGVLRLGARAGGDRVAAGCIQRDRGRDPQRGGVPTRRPAVDRYRDGVVVGIDGRAGIDERAELGVRRAGSAGGVETIPVLGGV